MDFKLEHWLNGYRTGAKKIDELTDLCDELIIDNLQGQERQKASERLNEILGE